MEFVLGSHTGLLHHKRCRVDIVAEHALEDREEDLHVPSATVSGVFNPFLLGHTAKQRDGLVAGEIAQTGFAVSRDVDDELDTEFVGQIPMRITLVRPVRVQLPYPVSRLHGLSHQEIHCFGSHRW